ncbi:MAG TPA: GTPase HflX [Candidatus Avamphibacillus sp.]|nr:GTPase HflX [Candidatus Avamphibacillus sp.]
MKRKSKVVIVGVDINREHEDFQYSMQELGNLAAACNLEVVSEVTQNLNYVNQANYIGTGKMQELQDMVRANQAIAVIFDDELSPSQIRNLEKALKCEVLDRTMLILEIFARRAKTKESKLQVEIARLKYMLPRLVGMRESLGRQGGGAGLKNRGAGETKLELDRRKIEEKIAQLNRELEKLVDQRETQRKRRNQNGLPIVSLVGYTNAGKSTIMNTMLDLMDQENDKMVFEKDMLFATLETSVRRVTSSTNRTFLLTDTVGFINKLPHHLVKAFRSTLEEVVEADLLVHVVDYSNPHYEEQIALTNKILAEIGVEEIPVIYAYNKTDLVEGVQEDNDENHIYVSGKNKLGIEVLTQTISEQVFHDYVHCELLIPYTEGQVVAYFNENAHVLSERHEEDGTRLEVECRKADAKRYDLFVIEEKGSVSDDVYE